MIGRVNFILGPAGRVLEDLRTLSDDAEASPVTITRGNYTLSRELQEALVDVREAVACLEDALVSLHRAGDILTAPPEVPVGTTHESLFQQLAAMPDGDKLFGHDKAW
jgi:hypothetical protein|tara:strand:- start:387 stop:710 length:324 start_codon:yes stop_codon:yes gene_type:complete